MGFKEEEEKQVPTMTTSRTPPSQEMIRAPPPDTSGHLTAVIELRHMVSNGNPENAIAATRKKLKPSNTLLTAEGVPNHQCMPPPPATGGGDGRTLRKNKKITTMPLIKTSQTAVEIHPVEQTTMDNDTTRQ